MVGFPEKPGAESFRNAEEGFFDFATGRPARAGRRTYSDRFAQNDETWAPMPNTARLRRNEAYKTAAISFTIGHGGAAG